MRVVAHLVVPEAYPFHGEGHPWVVVPLEQDLEVEGFGQGQLSERVRCQVGHALAFLVVVPGEVGLVPLQFQEAQ